MLPALKVLLFSGETNIQFTLQHINALTKIEAEWTLIAPKPEQTGVANKELHRMDQNQGLLKE